jgi:hypothetical protein
MESDPRLSFAPPATLRISGATGSGMFARIQNVIADLS